MNDDNETDDVFKLLQLCMRACRIYERKKKQNEKKKRKHEKQAFKQIIHEIPLAATTGQRHHCQSK